MKTIVEVNDPDDPRIAVFRAVRERDIAGRDGGFIAEGEIVLRVLARSPLYRTLCLLIAARRLETQSALIALFADDVAVYSAGQAVMDAVVGFPIHRGMLAFGLRGPAPEADALLEATGETGMIVALMGVANHDNVGGVFRNAAAFGVAAILLDGACCDPLYRKAIRVSAGAALTVPFARLPAGADTLALLQRQGCTPLALSPAGATPLHDLVPPRRAALLLGAEGHGLPAAMLERARTVAIPMAAGVDSLNVATATGIALHYLARR